MKKGGLFKTNWAYLLWLCFYLFVSWLILGASLQSLYITLILYVISITIALTIGEYILRFIEGLRRIATKEEKEYLLEIFEEVYEEAKEVNSNLNDNIELFISDKMYINAYAMGRKTVVLTKGAIATFSRDELKGVLGHELGHLGNGDTKALLLNIIGNGIFTILVIMLRFAMFIFTLIVGIADGSGIVALIMQFVQFILNIALIVLLGIGNVIMALNSRYNEYQADKFAFNIGVGAELIEALKILEKVSITGDISLLERLQASHPHLAYRIAKLEEMEELQAM